MPEAKMRKYVVTLQRSVKNIVSTISLVIEASHRRKAVFLAEQLTNKNHPQSNKNMLVGWKVQRIEVVENESDIPNDIDVE